MKIAHLIAAATMIAGLGVSSAASAQDYRHDGRYERRYDRHDERRGHNWRGDRHRGYGAQRRCRVEYRHHRRVTVCYR